MGTMVLLSNSCKGSYCLSRFRMSERRTTLLGNGFGDSMNSVSDLI